MATATPRACQFCRPPFLRVATSTPPISDQVLTVRQALARLRQIAPRSARALELHHIEGLTLPEIQNQLNLTPTQLRSLLRTAKKQLRKLLP